MSLIKERCIFCACRETLEQIADALVLSPSVSVFKKNRWTVNGPLSLVRYLFPFTDIVLHHYCNPGYFYTSLAPQFCSA